MTSPKVETTTVDGNRWYVDKVTGERVPGVSAIKDCLNKPALVGAAARESAIYAVENIDAMKALAETDPQAAIDSIKSARFRVWGRKADAGTDVHAIAEALLRGEKGVKVTPLQRKSIVNYARWHKKYNVRARYVEATVWSAKHQYAGTMDTLADITLSEEEADRLGTDREVTAIVDIKTGASGVWPETALQQVAYKKADYILLPDGQRITMPDVDLTFALWLRPEGYAFIPLDSSDFTWKTFVALRQAYDWHRAERGMVLPALNEDAIKRKWRGK